MLRFPHLPTILAILLLVSPVGAMEPAEKNALLEQRQREARLRDEKLLTQLKVDTTPEGVLVWLKGWVPQRYTPEEASSLIERLGSEQFAQREAAGEELGKGLRFPRALLLQAANSNDLEIRWRARSVLREQGKHDWRGFHAALRQLVRAQPPPGAVETVLELASSYHEDFHVAVFDQILPRVIDDTQRHALLVQLEHADPARRWVVAKLLLTSHPQQARAAMLRLAEEVDGSRFSFLAARHLANEGERRALEPLVRLLTHPDSALADDAAALLESLTQQDFPWPADAEGRRLGAARWRTWLEREGDKIVWQFPLIDSVVQRGNLSGNTLVATGSRGKLLELTPTGKTVWEYPANAWSVEKLRNGNYVIASYTSNQVLEVDAAGSTLWQRQGINAMRAKPLPDDHLLIALFSSKQVIELDQNRHEVWSHSTPENCFDVERLSNGNTIFACPNLVCEITPGGEVVRSLPVKGRVNSIQVVPGGNWLVANYEMNEVQLYNRKGEKIWHAQQRHPNDAFRLRNGHTLVASEQHCVELDRAGQVIRVVCEANYGGVRQ